MNKKNIALIISILAAIAFWASKSYYKKKDSSEKTSITKVEASFYWTCPMHPQIHLDHAGECPICHMKLVKVIETTQNENQKSEQGDKRTPVITQSNQLELIGIQKSPAEKMTLHASIPISGRVLNSSTVAFQIYEKDLKYIHTGLSFEGDSSVDFEEKISGTISSIDAVVDPTSRTIRVIGSIKNSPKGILSETSFSGKILLVLNNRLAIPESSVLHTGTDDLVYLVENQSKLTPKKVKLGIKTEGFYEVLSGLNENDMISSGPNFLIDSEAKIRGAND